MKILAIKLRAIGDTVIWTSSLAALRERYPNAEITVLTYTSNAPVLAGLPYRTLLLKTKSRVELWRALWSLRAVQYDWLLAFHATTRLARSAWISGAKRMCIHHHSWNYTPPGSIPILAPGKLEDAITRDYRVLEAMTGAMPERKPTRLAISEAESERGEREVRDKILSYGGDPDKRRYAFLPGAAHHLRRYPKDLWLAEVIRARRDWQPIVLADAALSVEWNLREECKRIGVPLFDEGSLRDFIVRVSRAEKALANDSGPGHMAVAAGVKTTFAFGPGCVGDWHPYDPQTHPVARVHVDCRLEGPRDQERFQFCTVDQCAHHSCMRNLVLK